MLKTEDAAGESTATRVGKLPLTRAEIDLEKLKEQAFARTPEDGPESDVRSVALQRAGRSVCRGSISDSGPIRGTFECI
jgi:hypothetical protein